MLGTRQVYLPLLTVQRLGMQMPIHPPLFPLVISCLASSSNTSSNFSKLTLPEQNLEYSMLPPESLGAVERFAYIYIITREGDKKDKQVDIGNCESNPSTFTL